MKLQKKMLSAILAMAFVVTGFSVPGQPVANAATAEASTSTGYKVIETGKKYLHTPYKFGSSSTTTRTFDCSSFVQRVYKSLGINLPRSSRQQAKVGVPVSKSNLQVGDLIFFRSYGSKSNRITHVAIYAGNNQILHTYGKPGVTFSKWKGTSWEKRFVTARRVL
jgi:lipoprotein Spr